MKKLISVELIWNSASLVEVDGHPHLINRRWGQLKVYKELKQRQKFTGSPIFVTFLPPRGIRCAQWTLAFLYTPNQ